MEKELLSVLSDVQIILMTPQDIVNAFLLNFVVQKYLTREAQSWDIWVYPFNYVLSDFGTDCDKFPTIPITLIYDDIVLYPRVDLWYLGRQVKIWQNFSCSLKRLRQVALPTIVSQMIAARANSKGPPHLDIFNVPTVKISKHSH